MTKTVRVLVKLGIARILISPDEIEMRIYQAVRGELNKAIPKNVEFRSSNKIPTCRIEPK
jgi:hypothetical protein